MMKRTTLALALLLASLVCSVKFVNVADAQTRININKTAFARQFAGGEAGGVASSFSPKDHTIYCVVGLTTPVPDATFKFVWTRYDQSQRKQVSIFEQELSNQTTNTIAAKISSPTDWAEGQYNVDIYVNGRLNKKGLAYFVRKGQ